MVSLFRVEVLTSFENGEEVVGDAEFSEDGFFLGEVAHAVACSFVHGLVCDVFILEADATVIRAHKAGDHVEGGGFSGAIWSEEADDFSRFDSESDFIDDAAAAI